MIKRMEIFLLFIYLKIVVQKKISNKIFILSIIADVYYKFIYQE